MILLAVSGTESGDGGDLHAVRHQAHSTYDDHHSGPECASLTQTDSYLARILRFLCI